MMDGRNQPTTPGISSSSMFITCRQTLRCRRRPHEVRVQPRCRRHLGVYNFVILVCYGFLYRWKMATAVMNKTHDLIKTR